MRAALLLLPLLAGCDLSMKDQPRGDPQGSATLWPGGPPRQAPPEGTVARDQPLRDAALSSPPPLTAALLARGAERYGIYCAPCHGRRGYADGPIVRRGFPAPPRLDRADLVAAPPAHVVAVITHGKGIMYPYNDRVEPTDRWAIAAHVKVLQRASALEARR